MSVASVMLLAVACGSGGGTGSDGGGALDLRGSTADLAMLPPDMTINNPRNPIGAGPASVKLGTTNDSAGTYILLAKTAITNVTGSAIAGGDIGISPAKAASITGIAMTPDASNIFSTSVILTAPGKIYASDYAVPSPVNLTAAILSMQNAYTDAAGRNPPDHLNLGSGNLGGLTLAPGLYTWGSSVTIPTDVTLSGGADDVWIFQVSGDLELATAHQVVMSGGAQAKNVFWQVAGAVTIHANAHFEGVIMGQTGIVLQTGASLHGRALAQSMIALDNNALTAP